MSLLSVIVPCYNEEENVDCFYEELMKNTPFFEKEGLDVEILYVDDGSKDRTVEEVKDLKTRDDRVRLVSFPEISEKSPLSLRGFRRRRATMWL